MDHHKASGVIAAYLSESQQDQWNTPISIGLGVTTTVLLAAFAIGGVWEEHAKKTNLQAIDNAYKEKIKLLKSYFFNNGGLTNLKDYHANFDDLPRATQQSAFMP